ncbi:hypothetical protein WAI453_012601 [Rhynchosporium graminicola]
MDDKPETISWYRCVLDSRQLDFFVPRVARLPIGALFNTNPPKEVIDTNTGQPITPATSYEPRILSAKELAAPIRLSPVEGGDDEYTDTDEDEEDDGDTDYDTGGASLENT